MHEKVAPIVYLCMEKTIRIDGKIDDALAKSIIAELSDLEGVSQLNVHISSQGGAVYSGFEIYNKLKDIRKSGIKVVTYAGSFIQSIGEIVFHAGEERLISMLSCPWTHPPAMGGQTKDWYLANYNELVSIEDKMFKIRRATASPDVTDEHILKELSEETFYTPEEYLRLGYATGVIDNTAFASREENNISETITPNKMDQEEKKIDSLTDRIDKLLTVLSLKKPSAATNEAAVSGLVLTSAAGVQITFDGLKDGESPSIGDTAKIEGAPASGEYTMPSGDVYKFEAGVLVEIYNQAEEIEALKAEKQKIETELATALADIDKYAEVVTASVAEVQELKTKVSAMAVEKRMPATADKDEPLTLTQLKTY